jgi:hypothetical protein
MKPYRDAIQKEMEALMKSRTQASLAHAKALRALVNTSQSVEDFRKLCVPVPMVEEKGRWQLEDARAAAQVRGLLMVDDTADDREMVRRFEDLLQHIHDTFKTSAKQMALPVLSMHAAKWVIFYRKRLFDACSNPLGMAIMGNGDPRTLLAAMEVRTAYGDPVVWHFKTLGGTVTAPPPRSTSVAKRPTWEGKQVFFRPGNEPPSPDGSISGDLWPLPDEEDR